MKHASASALILANTAPLVGVFYFGWNVSDIIFIYWTENIVIGFFNVLRMRKAKRPGQKRYLAIGGSIINSTERSAVGWLFAAHYGVFTLLHGVFVLALFGIPTTAFSGLVFAVFALFASHGISYAFNFVAKGEYKNVSVDDLFLQPYKRVVVIHVVIIVGAWLAISGSAASIVLLVAAKIILDAASHAQEHKKFSRLPSNVIS